MRDRIPNGNEHFLPWLLGSQACEQTFRAARSMTGTFSTVINFTLLGFLHRLHRLQIQLELESETQETGIEYPRVMAHTKKVGYEALKEITDLKWFSWHPPLSLQTFSLGNNEKDLSQSCSINNYVFTLSSRCFQLLQMEKPDGIVPQGILTNDVVKVELLCAKLITLSEESLLYIEKTF